MATYYLRTRNQLASKNRGAAHADYIAGQGRYRGKEEVAQYIDANLPNFASTFKDFLEAADKNEGVGVRAYRSLIVGIPKEAGDKFIWAQQFSNDLLGDSHAYRLALHDDVNNPHFHLSFSERQNTPESLKMTPKKYFSRCNKKKREMNKKQWLFDAKDLYLKHIRLVCPNYAPTSNGGEVKIGPKLVGATPAYEVAREQREFEVWRLRKAKAELNLLEIEIKASLAKRFKAICVKTIKGALPLFQSLEKGRGLPIIPQWVLDENRQMPNLTEAKSIKTNFRPRR